ncbi:pyridoxal 5'-phosphate synthase glutaminase subunit PdxT [Microbacterium gorillae]|uniref:pyridoxal 5'-phosphate synthase glutaminase subunit PdxT n=1 Tax=Microbacterium gorillae TaxID=1231063 RepID=UPI000ADD7E02|nr:pyridoxal 5'-phosphate synthase glutaminase subunit PdxT [Microbacterium gorillae]
MAGRPRVGVLALQGGVREHLDMLRAVDAEGVPVRRAEEIAELDGLVIPGGESGVIFRLADTFGLVAPLRHAIGAGLPVLGTCAGLILLADRIENPAPGQGSLGGLDVTVRRNAFGSQLESFDAAVSVLGLDAPVDVAFIRAPEIVSVGAGVEVIATLPDGRIVGARSGRVTGVSFHPEVTGDARLHAAFVAGLTGRRAAA